jgi:hypothetical protein
MSNEPESDDSESSQGDAVSNLTGAVDDAMSKLGSPGEKLVVLGAALMLLVDIFGDIVFQDYSFSSAAWVPAVLIVVAVVLHRFRNAALPMSYAWLLAGLGFVAGIVAARELVDDVRYEYLERGGATIVFALVFYAAGALALVGASLLWQSIADRSSED